MSRSQKELLKSIDDRLKHLLRLQAMEQLENDATVKEKVRQLHPMGFSNQEMAEIIGTTSGTVSNYKSELNKEDEVED